MAVLSEQVKHYCGVIQPDWMILVAGEGWMRKASEGLLHNSPSD